VRPEDPISRSREKGNLKAPCSALSPNHDLHTYLYRLIMSYLESLFSLQGRTALVTGGTRGIGAELALALANAGSDIILIQRSGLSAASLYPLLSPYDADVLLYHSVEENTKTRDAILALGRKARIVVADLADAASIKALVPNLVKDGTRIHILVNCGGIQRRHKAEVFPDSDWDEVLQVNLSTCFTLARYARILL
jgi:2-deoxy-D-gluconate 3-dehydrogenase